MKHIKSKRLFEDYLNNETVLDIKDICLELQDAGFSVGFYADPRTRLIIRKFIGGVITHSYDALEYKYAEVKEVVERLKDYLGDKFVSIEVLAIKTYTGPSHWVNIESQYFQKNYSNPSNAKISSVEVVWDSTYKIPFDLDEYKKQRGVFESANNVEDLKDICLELQDEGFTVRFNPYDGYNEIRIIHRRHGNNVAHDPFNYNQVSEVVKRLEDYLGDKIKGIEILSEYAPAWITVTSHDKYFNRTVRGVSIEYNI